MGKFDPPEKCFITDADTQRTYLPVDAVQYHTTFGGEQFNFIFPVDHHNSDLVESNKHILKGLILNGKFLYEADNPNYSNERLEKILNQALYPKIPKARLDNLIRFLYDNQPYDGSEIDRYLTADENMAYRLYFKNKEEYFYYLSSLREQGYIQFQEVMQNETMDGIRIVITFKGLEYIIGLQERGEQSNYCFVAMSFSESMMQVRECLKETIKGCGYEPILVDEIHIESETTINDAMISNIKKCKFLVADFTQQKHGVYFEAGYALGKNKPVIYLCRDDDFENSHFDTNHYPHITYAELPELSEKLKLKIEAWID